MLMGRLYPYYRFLRDFRQYIWHEKHKRKHFLTLRQLFGRTSFSSSFLSFCSALMKYRLFSANLCRELLYTDWPLRKEIGQTGPIFDHSKPMEHLQGPSCPAQPPCEHQAAALLSSFVVALPRQWWSVVPQVSFHPEKWNSYMLEH